MTDKNRQDKELKQDRRLVRLVEAFKADSCEYKDLATPADWEDRRRLLRSLWGFGCRTGAFYLCQQYCSLPMGK